MFFRKITLLLLSVGLLFQAQTLYACAEMADMGPMHECCCPEAMAPAPDSDLSADDCCCEIEIEFQVASADLENGSASDTTLLLSPPLKIPISLFFEEIPLLNPLPPIAVEEPGLPFYTADQIASVNSQLYLTTSRLRL